MMSTTAYETGLHSSQTQGSLERVLQVFLNGGPNSPRSVRRDVAIFHNHAPGTPERLASDGYLRQLRFAVLPSRGNPRWLLPLTKNIGGFAGLEVYKPFSNRARMLKALVLLAKATGWDGWVKDELLVASRSPLPVERLVRKVTGEHNFVLTVSVGTPGAFQKLTVQVTLPNGRILGYLKMPLTAAAEQRLSNEAEFLHKLSEMPGIRSHIPSLLFGARWNETFTLLESALEGSNGPIHFSKRHKEFLAGLHDCWTTVLPGQRLIQRVAQRWESVAPRMGTKWQALGRETLKIADVDLRGSLVSCGIHHGDFAPWNMRTNRDDLIVFYWESATWEAPTLWDQFHFIDQTESLLKTRNPDGEDVRNQYRGQYLLYLLNYTAQLKEEGAGQKTVDYREQQILRHLSATASN